MSSWGSANWSGSSWGGSTWGSNNQSSGSNWWEKPGDNQNGASGGGSSWWNSQAAQQPQAAQKPEEKAAPAPPQANGWKKEETKPASGSGASEGTKPAATAPAATAPATPASTKDKWWLGVDADTRKKYAQEMREWLSEIDRSFDQYFKTIEENYDTVDQIVRLYTVEGQNGKSLDPLFFDDNKVTSEAHRLLFKNWFGKKTWYISTSIAKHCSKWCDREWYKGTCSNT